jgi:hypothetical protein
VGGVDVGELRRRRIAARLGRGVDEDVDAAAERRNRLGDRAPDCASSAVSATTPTTVAPVSLTSSAAVAASRSASRARMATEAPSSARPRAIALPMPRLPPVTRARLFRSSRSIPMSR